MSHKITTLRIDEILLSEGFVSEEQIKEALAFQKEYGGKLGSHLLRFGYINETKLLAALEKQFGCESIQLSEIEIPEIVLRFIPARIALARGVIPFDYDTENNILKVACENPVDRHLRDELRFLARGKGVRLYVAAETALKSAFARYYSSAELAPETEKVASEKQAAQEVETEIESSITTENEKAILLVSDEQEDDELLRRLLEQEQFRVEMVDSADSAITVIGDKKFGAVFIRDTVQGDYIDLIDRLRKISPSIKVRYYESAGKLLLDDIVANDSTDLMVRNLDLLTSLLTLKEKLPSNHAGMVGHYANQICLRLGLPAKDRLAIMNAAYLHDLAKFYYGDVDQTDDQHVLVTLTAKLLESLDYSPLVIGVLRSMYMNLGNKYTRRLPIEVLGGSIVTLADIFCEHLLPEEKISLDRFDELKGMLHDMVGKLLLIEVVEAFLDLVQEEVLAVPNNEGFCQVMIYSEESQVPVSLEDRLEQEGFRTVIQTSIDKLVDLFERSHPDILILFKPGVAPEIVGFVDGLTRRGIDINSVSTLLLTDSSFTQELALLLERGIEDIIRIDDNPDLLIVKMKKILERLKSNKILRSPAGSQVGIGGSLKDMNLIGLLQALGPGIQTVRIVIRSHGHCLTVYLDHGNIVFAELNDRKGAGAIYDAVSWSDGSWTVDPVSPDSLPDSNNELANEYILAECRRLLDEHSRNRVESSTMNS